MIHNRETINVRLNHHPTVWSHILTGNKPLHQAAAYFRPFCSIIDHFEAGDHLRRQRKDRLDRHTRWFALGKLPMLEENVAPGIFNDDILNSGYVRDKGDQIVSIQAFDDLKLRLDFILKAIVAGQYLLGPLDNLQTRDMRRSW